MVKNQLLEIIIAGWQASRRRLAGELFSIPAYRSLVLKFPKTGPQQTNLPRLIKANPDHGKVLAQGHFILAGASLDIADAKELWSKPVPTRRFAAKLHEFNWIHDLLSAGAIDAEILVAAHVDYWVRVYGHWNPFSWTPALAARRCLNWLCVGQVLLGEGKAAALRRDSLVRQVAYLHSLGNIASDTRDRLQIALAIVATGMLLPGAEKYLERGLALFAEQLAEQILPDGGHISRNPEMATLTLCDLVAIKTLFEQHNTQVPDDLNKALARLAPMVRFLCAADGHLVAFNGGGEGRTLTTKRLLHDLSTPESAFSYAPHSGYQRVKTASSVLIMDTGRPPPERFSQGAHAGALAFELSTPGGRLIVNCGWSEDQPDPWHLAVRSSAAHSTLVINDSSSAQIRAGGLRAALLGPRLRQRGNANPSRRSIESGTGTKLEASHGGYLHQYGLIHQRQILVSTNGEEFLGEDKVFRPLDAPKVSAQAVLDCALRFHLHPKVRASQARDGAQVLLVLPDGTGWRFHCENAVVELQPSVYLGAGAPPMRTVQMVVQHAINTQADITDPQNHFHWSIKRM